MRLWHKKLTPYLPDMQLKGQWRECCLIADALAKNGTPNHLLVNRMIEYEPNHFEEYFLLVIGEMRKRGFSISKKSGNNLAKNFSEYALNPSTKRFSFILSFAKDEQSIIDNLFPDWHNKEYLRVCMANLYEKHFFGVGKSRITDAEWETLCRGYKEITGEEYVI